MLFSLKKLKSYIIILFCLSFLFIGELQFAYTQDLAAYAFQCIDASGKNLGPLIVDSNGNILSDVEIENEFIPYAVQEIKGYIKIWESFNEQEKQMALDYIKYATGYQCTITDHVQNTITTAGGGGVINAPDAPKPLKFKPEVGFPGFEGVIEISGFSLGTFLQSLLKYLVYLSGVIAVIVLVVAGFQWVLAGGNPSLISGAKERIKNALIGVVLCSCSYLILYTINPELLNIKEIKVYHIEPVVVEDTALNLGGAFPFAWQDNECPEYKTGNNSGSDLCPDMGVIPGTSCQRSEIIEIAQKFIGCANGPCHCACFASSVLKAAGCKLSATNTAAWCRDSGGHKYSDWRTCDKNIRAGSLMQELLYLGWKIYPKEQVTPEIGDIIMGTGHVEIVMDKVQSIGSSRHGGQQISSDAKYWHVGSDNYRSADCTSMQGIWIRNDFIISDDSEVIIKNPNKNDTAEIVNIPQHPALIIQADDPRGTRSAVNKLMHAVQCMERQGLKIQLSSAYRSRDSQAKLYNDCLKAHGITQLNRCVPETGCGGKVCCPFKVGGVCPHLTGNAFDAWAVPRKYSTQFILQDCMYAAGFWNYGGECWHFEAVKYSSPLLNSESENPVGGHNKKCAPHYTGGNE